MDATTTAGTATGTRAVDRRKTHRIDPAFQSRFRVRILLLALLVALFAMVLSWAVVLVLRNPDPALESPWVPLGLLVAGVLAGGLVVYRCDRLSHRYCGPAFRLTRTLEAICDGERPAPIRLREGDEFQELAEVLNKALRHLGAMDPAPGDRRDG